MLPGRGDRFVTYGVEPMDEATVGRSTVREKGQMTLPARVREALRVEVGDEIEFEVVTTGEVVMRGLKMIPADQAWFWSKSWQRGEREASADIASGRVETFEDAESLLDFIGAGEEGDA
jgi:antitoxin PrlF